MNPISLSLSDVHLCDKDLRSGRTGLGTLLIAAATAVDHEISLSAVVSSFDPLQINPENTSFLWNARFLDNRADSCCK